MCSKGNFFLLRLIIGLSTNHAMNQPPHLATFISDPIERSVLTWEVVKVKLRLSGSFSTKQKFRIIESPGNQNMNVNESVKIMNIYGPETEVQIMEKYGKLRFE